MDEQLAAVDCVYSLQSSASGVRMCKQPLFQSRIRLSDEQDIFQGDAAEQHTDSANLERKNVNSEAAFSVFFLKRTFVWF